MLPQYGTLLNWGCSQLPLKVAPGQTVLNKPEAVANAKCKLRTFELFRKAGVPHPQWWTPENVKEAKRQGAILIARTTTRGSGGEGIVVVREEDKLPKAPLYTLYIRKDSEYRVHVVGDKAIQIQQKRKDTEAEQDQDQKLIRNHANGWVFAVNNVQFKNDRQRERVVEASIAAVRSLGLDFGAVDLVVDRKTGEPFVLEVNTAPGLESPTLIGAYATSFATITGGNNRVEERGGVGRPRILPRR